jgi:queuine tRNA-ribosyltransferase
LHFYAHRTQALYGIIQGGIYEDLRDESTDFINKHAFFGTAIGGSLGASKKNMHDIVAYTRARVRDDRPVHLLGIGGVRDIFHGVRQGIDTFDCVHPSRLARHGGALGECTPVFFYSPTLVFFYSSILLLPSILLF